MRDLITYNTKTKYMAGSPENITGYKSIIVLIVCAARLPDELDLFYIHEITSTHPDRINCHRTCSMQRRPPS